MMGSLDAFLNCPDCIGELKNEKIIGKRKVYFQY